LQPAAIAPRNIGTVGKDDDPNADQPKESEYEVIASSVNVEIGTRRQRVLLALIGMLDDRLTREAGEPVHLDRSGQRVQRRETLPDPRRPAEAPSDLARNEASHRRPEHPERPN
jgi:hypothetical protein